MVVVPQSISLALTFACFATSGVLGQNGGPFRLEFEPAPDARWTHVARGRYTTLVSKAGFTVIPNALRPTRVRFDFVGTRPRPPLEEERAPGVSHYLQGTDPSEWRTDVPRFRRLRFASVWKGVDVVLYGDNDRLRYDFEIEPGRGASEIQIRVHGARLELHDGSLQVVTPGHSLVQPPPFAFQPTPEARIPVESEYVLFKEDRFGVRIGPCDPTLPVVIDPVVGLTSWLGGSSNDWPLDVAVDAQGFAYVVGATASFDFPTASPLQGSLQGGADAFVTKIDPTGSTIVWSTYLGGTRGARVGVAREGAVAVAVDASGAPVVVGYTEAVDFPVTANAPQRAFGGLRDLFVARIDASGNAIAFATYLGGSATEAIRIGESAGGSCDVAIDPAGNTVVCGTTNSYDLPVVRAVQTALGGAYDALVASYSPTGSLLTSTYFGGSEVEAHTGIATSPSGDVVVSGSTLSADMPWTPGAWSGGNWKFGFVARFTPLARQLTACSSFPAEIQAVDVATDGDVVVCGDTTDESFVRTRGSLHVGWTGASPLPKSAFITRMHPDLSALRWSTLVGAVVTPKTLRAMAVNPRGDISAALSGRLAGGTGFSTDQLISVSADGRALTYSVPLQVYGAALAISATGSTWIVGSSTPPHGPVQPTPNAFQQNPNGWAEGIVQRVDETPASRLSLGPLDAVVHEGETFDLTVALDAPAPAGGTTLSLAGTPANVLRHPATVTIPAGRTHRSFQVSVVSDALPGSGSIAASGALGSATMGFEIRRRAPFQLVGVMSPTGGYASAGDISPSGLLVGAAGYSGSQQAFSFSDATGIVMIPARTAIAVTRSGSIFGRLGTDTAYRLDPGGAVQALFGNAKDVTDASELGSVVGQTSAFSNGDHAFYWSPSTGMLAVGTSSGFRSWALAINAHDVVVGAQIPTGASTRRAFRWSRATGRTDLGMLLGHDASSAQGINDHGEICGYSTLQSSSRPRAVLFDSGSVRDLGVAAGRLHSAAWGINDHGHVVGRSPVMNGGAALWTETTGFVNLNELIDPVSAMGWDLHGAVSINDHGQIAGTGAWGSAIAAFRLDPTQTVRYGSGCPTRSGEAPILAGEGFPWRGSRFALVVDDATPLAPSVLLFGRARAARPLLGGCDLLVDSPIAVTTTVDASGRARETYRIPTTVPTDPLFVQLAQLDLQAPSRLLSMSNGLEIRIE